MCNSCHIILIYRYTDIQIYIYTDIHDTPAHTAYTLVYPNKYIYSNVHYSILDYKNPKIPLAIITSNYYIIGCGCDNLQVVNWMHPKQIIKPTR